MCLFCKHLRYNEATVWSSWTAEDADFTCIKNHFSYCDPEYMAGEVYKHLGCPDFEWSDEIKKLRSKK